MQRFTRDGISAVIVAVISLFVVSPVSYAFNYNSDAFDGVTFALETDKKTYSTLEPVRIEMSATNSTDEPLDLDYLTVYQGSHRYSLTSLSVTDIATDKIVLFGQPLKKLNKVLVPANGRSAFAVGDIPANKLLGGNKKYLIHVRLAVPLKCGDQGRHCGQINTEISTVITVR